MWGPRCFPLCTEPALGPGLWTGIIRALCQGWWEKPGSTGSTTSRMTSHCHQAHCRQETEAVRGEVTLPKNMGESRV